MRAVPVLLLVTAALAGCGGGDDKDDEQAQQTVSTEVNLRPDLEQPERGGGPPPGTKDEDVRDENPAGKEALPLDEAEPGMPSPAKVEPSGKPAAEAVEKSVGEDIEGGRGDERTVIGARCSGGTCVVRYRVRSEGSGDNIADQQSILRTLFADEGVERVQLLLHHHTTGRKQPETEPYITVDCRRSEHPDFAWEKIIDDDIEDRCDLTRS